MKNTERIDNLNSRVDDVNKRLDDLNSSVSVLSLEMGTIKGDLRAALSTKEIIEDVIIRIERLESKIAA